MEPRGVTWSLQFLAALFHVLFTHWCNQRSRPLVLVRSGVHDTIPRTVAGLKQQTFLLSQFWGWKSKIRVPAWLGASDSSLPGLQEDHQPHHEGPHTHKLT